MKKKVFFDMALNLMATGFPIAVLQLVIYPMMSNALNEHTYGLMIAIYSMMLLFSDSLGRSINNERLISSNEEENVKGDFNPTLLFYQILNVIIIGIGSYYYIGKVDLVTQSIIIITSIFMLASAYLVVYYRILLNYVAIVKNSCAVCLGFVLGFLLYKVTGIWMFVFFLGQMLQFVYLAFSTKLLTEPFKRTIRFKDIFRDSSMLAASLLLSQSINLADKLLLFPLLGGGVLSIYYTASLVGKILTVTTGPVNSVILSYLARKDTLPQKLFKKYLLLCTSFCILLSVMILVLSKPVLGLLFPKFVDGAIKLVPFTTANIFFYIMAGMITPVVMRYCAASWQVIINSVSFVIYITGSIVLLKIFGIIGFCIGIGFSHIVRFVLLLLVYYNRANKKPDNMATDNERGNENVGI